MERLDHYMERAARLYYANHDPFADFVTAPEISQVFGELLGAWCVEQWQRLGEPDPVLLIELGPGRGTLMADALRTIGALAPPFAAALDLHFVETSPRLIRMLHDAFPGATLHDTTDTLPPGPTIFLANEFLDALPIREFVRRGERWTERYVADGAFAEADLGTAPRRTPTHPHEGDIAVAAERADDVVASVAARVAQGRSIALFIDYGGELDRGSTLQALHEGRHADPLAAPGEADITAHVDFAAVIETAREAGAAVHGPLPQGLFLTRLGLYQRIARLAETVSRSTAVETPVPEPGIRTVDGGSATPRWLGNMPSDGRSLIAAASRLAQPEGMGVLFKALALTPPTFPTPSGFA